MKSPKRQNLLPVAAGIVSAAVVFGALAVFLNRDAAGTKPSENSAVETPAANPSAPVASADTPRAAQAEPAIETPAAELNPHAPVAKVTPAAEEPAAVSLRDRVSGHLDAGEFGPAIELAKSAADDDERTELLELVADAQMSAGEFDTAALVIRQIPNLERRSQAQRERVTNESLAGGSGADYDTLIDLIINHTVGPWESIDGEGAPDPTEYDNGVRVDPNGLLYRLAQTELDGRLAALGHRARKADLNDDMAQSSALRLVSLTRLEKEIARRLAAGQPVLETMRHLAGLSQIRHVFVYPEEGEIVIGGPAEAWRIDASGASIGVESGRPTLQLDDFVTVLRTFGPEGAGVFRCSIDPRPQGLADVRRFVAETNARGAIDSSAVSSFAKQLEQKVGLQDIVVNGVPLDSRVARVIVEADYRMKLIGIDKLDSRVGIPSYFDLLPPEERKASAETAALRWWMTMKYDAVLHSPDRDVYEIQGSSVLCQSEDEMIGEGGKRVHTGKAEATNRLFAGNFTDRFAELAAVDPIFGDLQNIFDLSLVAALVRHDKLDERVNWDHGVFAADGEYETARFEPPRTVMSVVNHRVYPGGNIVVQVAGGVTGDLMSIVQNSSVYKEAVRLANSRDRGKPSNLPEGRWWWDAAK